MALLCCNGFCAVSFRIVCSNPQKVKANLSETQLQLSCESDGKSVAVQLEFYQSVVPEKATTVSSTRGIEYTLPKKDKGEWPRLVSSEVWPACCVLCADWLQVKNSRIKVDWERFNSSLSDEQEAELQVFCCEGVAGCLRVCAQDAEEQEAEATKERRKTLLQDFQQGKIKPPEFFKAKFAEDHESGSVKQT